MKRMILMAVILCLITGLASQAQVKRGAIKRAQNSEQVVSGSTSEQTRRTLQKPSAKQDQKQVLKTDKNIKKDESDKTRKDAYRKYNVARKKVEKAQAKVNAAKQKIEKLEQERANERVAVAEKITSGNGLTKEEAAALEKALKGVDEKYGNKIAMARTELEGAQIDLEHAQSYLETAEMEYKAAN